MSIIQISSEALSTRRHTQRSEMQQLHRPPDSSSLQTYPALHILFEALMHIQPHSPQLSTLRTHTSPSGIFQYYSVFAFCTHPNMNSNQLLIEWGLGLKELLQILRQNSRCICIESRARSLWVGEGGGCHQMVCMSCCRKCCRGCWQR